MEFQDKEELVQCPYNKCHFVSKRRLQFHIHKCGKNNQQFKVICDFNSTHLVLPGELQYHYENCKDKKEYELHCHGDKEICINKFPVKNTDVEAEDNWDHDNYETYNPQDHFEGKDILRKPNNESRSKRKGFYYQERQRVEVFQESPQNGEPKPAEASFMNNNKVSKPAKLLVSLKMGSKRSQSNKNSENQDLNTKKGQNVEDKPENSKQENKCRKEKDENSNINVKVSKVSRLLTLLKIGSENSSESNKS